MKLIKTFLDTTNPNLAHSRKRLSISRTIESFRLFRKIMEYLQETDFSDIEGKFKRFTPQSFERI